MKNINVNIGFGNGKLSPLAKIALWVFGVAIIAAHPILWPLVPIGILIDFLYLRYGK